MDQFTDDVLAAAAREKEVVLTTQGRKTGKPRRVTIWLVTDGRRLFVRSGQGLKRQWPQNLLALDLPAAKFDGVFANAVLFHVPSAELPRVLRALHATLKPGGALFGSNPRGEGQEGWQGGRYVAFHDLQAWRSHMAAAGFTELEHYYRPDGLPREQQPWLASVWSKRFVDTG